MFRLFDGASFSLGLPRLPLKSGMAEFPLVRQTAYQSRGMNIGLAAGVLRPGGSRCHVLGQWQGTGNSLLEERERRSECPVYGGGVDKNYELMYQRYHLYVGGISRGSRFDFYLSPVVGGRTTNLSRSAKMKRRMPTGRRKKTKNLCRDSIP